MHFYYKYELPAIVNEGGDKRILVFGDSFAQLTRMAKHTISDSWISHLALQLDAQISSYGISGAAESTILYTYLKTYSEERDFTIIFHTHPMRPDVYFEQQDLIIPAYKKWDKALEKHPCLHLYWSETKHYKFKNGQKLSCDYWTNLHEKCENGEVSIDRKQEVDIRHHMTLEDNKHFATDVYNKIKGEF